MIWPWSKARRALEEFAQHRRLRVVRWHRHGRFELAGELHGESLRISTDVIQLGRDPQERPITCIRLGDGHRADDEWIDVRTLEEPVRATLSELARAAGEPEESALSILQLHETAGESRLTLLRPVSEPEQLELAIEAVVALRLRKRTPAD